MYCENRHRREDKERHDKLCSISPQLVPSKVVLAEEVPYKLVEIEGKGRGLVATRTLEVGELVISEKPFLKTTFKNMTDNDMAFFRLLEAEPDIRAKLMNLSYSADVEFELFKKFGNWIDRLRGEDQILLKKFLANAIGSDNDDPDPALQKLAAFETISMINHSCKPNVAWFTDEDEEEMEGRVCRRIQEGEEIVASYFVLSELPLRQQRRDMLRLKGFVCRLSYSTFFHKSFTTKV